jgi:hypothetical protein
MKILTINRALHPIKADHVLLLGHGHIHVPTLSPDIDRIVHPPVDLFVGHVVVSYLLQVIIDGMKRVQLRLGKFFGECQIDDGFGKKGVMSKGRWGDVR